MAGDAHPKKNLQVFYNMGSPISKDSGAAQCDDLRLERLWLVKAPSSLVKSNLGSNRNVIEKILNVLHGEHAVFARVGFNVRTFRTISLCPGSEPTLSNFIGVPTSTYQINV